MADFLDGCNDQHVAPAEFMDTFCKRCRNRECVRAGWAQDRFSTRVSTQEERLFNPERADPRLPKYAQILASEFKDMLQQAMALEVASQKGDWEIPQIPILDGGADIASPLQTQGVDAAVKVLAQARGAEPLIMTPEAPKVVTPEAPKVLTPEVPKIITPPSIFTPVPKAPKPPMAPPTGLNTVVPAGGMMLDGSPATPAQRSPGGPSPTAVDPWAPPAKKDVKVAPGARIKMGGEQEPPK